MTMLMNNKKSHSSEQNWCVVLNPIRNEIDKKRVAQKIAEVFSISTEEALDMVENTPIILLDNLTHATATKIQSFFSSSGADISLTNDVFRKRKCYRTVWPEPPKLSFLSEWQDEAESSSTSEALEPDEALNEIRSLAEEIKPIHSSLDEEIESEEESDLVELPDEMMSQITPVNEPPKELIRLQKECEALRAEASRLRQELTIKSKVAPLAVAGRHAELEKGLEQREREFQDLKVQLSISEERLKAVQEEYRDAKSVFEEKLSNIAHESEQWKLKLNEMTESVELLRQENLDLSAQLGASEAKIKKLQQDYDHQKSRMDQMGAALNQDIELWKNKVSEKDLVIQSLQRDKVALNSAVTELESKYRRLQEEFDKSRADFSTRLAETLDQMEQAQSSLTEFREKVQTLEHSMIDAERMVQERAHQAEQWREKYDAILKKVETVETENAEERHARLKAEERQRDAERNQSKLMQDLEKRTAEARSWELRCLEMDKDIAATKINYENKLKSLEAIAKLNFDKERELELSRKQIRDLNEQLEQRDAIYRRNQLIQEITLKENLLKGIIREQQKLESEMRERQESLNRLESDKAAMEKEILEGRQAQRHLLEMAKRERPGRIRIIKGNQNLDSSSQASTEEPPADSSYD